MKLKKLEIKDRNFFCDCTAASWTNPTGKPERTAELLSSKLIITAVAAFKLDLWGKGGREKCLSSNGTRSQGLEQAVFSALLSYYPGHRRIKNLGEYILHLRCKWVKIQQNRGLAASENETFLFCLNFVFKLFKGY